MYLIPCLLGHCPSGQELKRVLLTPRTEFSNLSAWVDYSLKETICSILETPNLPTSIYNCDAGQVARRKIGKTVPAYRVRRVAIRCHHDARNA